MTDPIRCITCGYVLWGLTAGKCPECGRYFDPAIPATVTTNTPFVLWRYWLPGFLLALGGGIVLYIAILTIAGFGWAVTLVAPIALGAAIGYGCPVRTRLHILLGLCAIITIVLTLYSASLVGIFCGLVLGCVMLIPTGVGIAAGVILRQRLKKSNFSQRYYLPLLTLMVFGLAVADRLTHRAFAVESIVTSVDIPSPVGKAWNALMFFEEVRHAPPWLLRIGLPRPLYTRGSTAHVGDEKVCIYTKGHLTKRVTERDPDHRLAFDVIEQDRIENRSIRLTSGSFDLISVSPSQTRVELTTNYEPKLGPRWIWRPAEQLATHALHRDVLEGMREKAAEP